MAATTAAVTALASGASLASASSHAPATGARSAPVPRVKMINLHRAYEQALPHAKTKPVSGIIYARGKLPKATAHRARQAHRAAGAATCTEPNCPLTYHGGSVQHTPQVYLLLWGPNWSTASEQSYSGDLEAMLGGLGHEPQDTWSTILSQYTDGTGFPAFFSPVFMGAWNDTSSPPYGATQAQLAAEADAFATSHGITDRADAQIVVATQSGTCPQGFIGAGCTGGYYCAWHSYSAEPYINLPYMLDAGTSCGEDFVNSNGTYDGLTMALGHEYAETVTDPDPPTGWIDQNDNISGGEIGDKCAWGGEGWGSNDPFGNVALWTGNFAMQSLWSNAGNDCALAQGVSDQVSVTSPGNQTSLSTQLVKLAIQGSSSGGNQLELHATGLPPGLGTSVSGSTLMIRGEPSGDSGVYHVTLQTADTTGSLSAPVSFTWTVIHICIPKVCP